MWLLEYFLLNKTPPILVVKLGFVLLPWPNKDPDGEQLPELLNMFVLFVHPHLWQLCRCDMTHSEHIPDFLRVDFCGSAS